MSPRRPSIVIVGGGFGGFFAARKLRRRLRTDEADVTLISDTDGMLYQPLLPDVAVGAIDPRIASVPLRQALPGVKVIRGRATEVDVEAMRVSVADVGGGQAVSYDYLLLAPGGVTRMEDLPGLGQRAVGFKTTAEALYLRELVLARMEAASSESDPTRRQAAITFVVVGAGYAGVELTAQMARMTRNLLPSFAALSQSEIRWLLLNHSTSIMPELGGGLGERALRVLRRRDVDVRLATTIKSVSTGTVTLTDDEVVGCSTVIWCAGVTANPLVATTGLPLDRGRLVVTPELCVEGNPKVFAIGDAAAVPDITKTTSPLTICPPTAQHAMRQGPAAARNILASIRGKPLRPYRHRDLGLVVDLGGMQAVARPVGMPLSGWPAKLLTRGYHLFALPSSRRRLSAMAGYALAGGRPDNVSFGLLSLNQALASTSEHAVSTSERDSAGSHPQHRRTETDHVQ
jgi:NADH:ubiquinone reductase (H+-translocating)